MEVVGLQGYVEQAGPNWTPPPDFFAVFFGGVQEERPSGSVCGLLELPGD